MFKGKTPIALPGVMAITNRQQIVKKRSILKIIILFLRDLSRTIVLLLKPWRLVYTPRRHLKRRTLIKNINLFQLSFSDSHSECLLDVNKFGPKPKNKEEKSRQIWG